MAPSRGPCAVARGAIERLGALCDGSGGQAPAPPPRPVGGTARRVALALLLGLLLSRAGRLLWRPRRRAASPRRREPGARAQAAAAEAEAEEPAPGAPRLRFKPTVTCCVVPNLCYLADEKKGKLWWHQKDFASFLKTRVELGRAYHLVAKRRGVAVGSAFPAEPALSHESRRGLGLGRKKQRDRNRQRYIQAVLDEQLRQRRDCLANIDVLERAGARRGPTFVLDAERLSQVALPCSESDRRYAVAQAREDYERTLQDPDPAEPGDGSWCDAPSPLSSSGERRRSLSLDEDGHELARMVRVDSFSLSDDEGAEGARGSFWGLPEEEMERYVSPSVSASKGFGLSRDDLEQAGLSATGHLMRRRPSPAPGEEAEGGASDVSQSDACASDASDGGADWE